MKTKPKTKPKTKRPTKGLCRKQMQRIADSLADVYPGKKLLVLMPGDPLPKWLQADG